MSVHLFLLQNKSLLNKLDFLIKLENLYTFKSGTIYFVILSIEFIKQTEK